MRTKYCAVAFLIFGGTLDAQTLRRLLWHDPGNVSKADLGGAVGTGFPAPKPPFTFIKEDMAGTQPKVILKDASGRTWNAKFGVEVKPECFAWRLPAAVGYFVEPSYYVAMGKIQGLPPMKRQ